MTCHLEIPTKIDEVVLASELRHLPTRDARGWVRNFISELDADLFHAVAVFIVENPDRTVECEHCHRFSYYHQTRLGIPGRCDHCKAIQP